MRGLLVSTLLAASLAATVACTTRLGQPARRGFGEAVRLYALGGEKKALALAVNENGQLAYGALYESLRQGDANERALEECRANARKNRIDAPCFLFAIGNAEAPDTVSGCAQGRIPQPRCIIQQRYAPVLSGG